MQTVGDHIGPGGRFQSDKYKGCPEGKVPLSTSDPMAQDLLWEYSLRRWVVDEDFSKDLQMCLEDDGYRTVRRAPVEEQPLAVWPNLTLLIVSLVTGALVILTCLLPGTQLSTPHMQWVLFFTSVSTGAVALRRLS